jgi:ABC-type transport system substrate-binding protein
VERTVTNVVPDTNTGYALWLNNEVDQSGIPDEELEAHLAEFPDETVQVADLAVFYIAFRETKAPFDDVHVRRAFSAAFDRDTYINEVRQGQGLAMTHFAPPGIFGAPPINEVGIGYDPDFARAELEAAGYPGCAGFPTVTLLGYSGASTLAWIEFAQANWNEVLGCDPSLIQIEQQSFADLLATTQLPDDEAPNMWTLGWGPDYGDENNWVGDVLHCDITTRIARTCDETDDLIVQAREESDPATRIALYRQIEENFFGPEGEVPMFPIFVRIAFTAWHSWYSATPALFGGAQWYNSSIDIDAKKAAQGQ